MAGRCHGCGLARAKRLLSTIGRPITALALSLGLVAGCATSDSPDGIGLAPADPTGDQATPALPMTDDDGTTPSGPATSEQAEPTTPAAPVTTGAVPIHQPSPSPDGLRLAPSIDEQPVVLIWAPSSAEIVNHAGEPLALIDADRLAALGAGSGLAAVAHTPAGLAFQLGPDPGAQERDPTVWFGGSSGFRELVNASDLDRLTLHGAASAGDEGVIVYSRTRGQPTDESQLVLWSMDPVTGTRTELGVIGNGADRIVVGDVATSHPRIPVLTETSDGHRITILTVPALGTTDDGEDASGSTGGSTGGSTVAKPATVTERVVCGPGPDANVACADYSHLALVGSNLYGLVADPVDQVQVLNRLNITSGVETEVVRFGWEPSAWQPVSLIGLGGDPVFGALVMVVADGQGRPLPAVMIDGRTGGARTLPTAGFVTHQYLS